MRIDQLLPSYGRFDAIGNDAFLLQQLLRREGFSSDIFTDLGQRQGETKPYHSYQSYSKPSNILIHHYSIGSDLPYFLTGVDAFKVTRYHNITPQRYFKHVSTLEAYFRCREGRCQLPLVQQVSDSHWSASQFNADELSKLNFKPGFVLPVLRRYDELAKGEGCPRKDKQLAGSRKKTMLFVGRIMPHKGHHDLIFLLKQYHKHVDENLRLIFVGGGDPYYMNKLLVKLAQDLGLKICFNPSSQADFTADVNFAGSTSEAELTSYYRHADVFVSMSEHEGFGVPLVEAMHFGLPVLAHRAAAVPETTGRGALLVDKNDPVATLDALYGLLHREKVQQSYRLRSVERAQAFQWGELEKTFHRGLAGILEMHKAKR